MIYDNCPRGLDEDEHTQNYLVHIWLTGEDKPRCMDVVAANRMAKVSGT